AFYPELLLIDAAKMDPSAPPGSGVFLSGYGPGVDWAALALLLPRLCIGLYLIASALTRYDRQALAGWETALRLVLAVLVLMRDPALFGPGLAVTALYLVWHSVRAGASKVA
ncbi:MAG TPA: C4-dicarboxylate ABC transporter, partial [Paracoccaceae bacterium]|nr:C4-dicarboxylate ABC transporter [Paracoccaceae bacterium]